MIQFINKFIEINKSNYINYLILIYAFTISFPTSIVRTVSILLILLWLLDWKSKIKLPDTKIFLYFGIFLIYCILSYAWSDATIKLALHYITRYWYFLPVFIVFKYLKKENFTLTITSFLLGMLVSEILSYGNFFGLWRVGYGSQNDPTVFMSHTMYGIILTISSLFLLSKLYHERKDKFWYLNLFFFLTITTNIFVNSGRTGYLTFLLTLITCVIILNLRNIKKMFRYLLFSFILLFIIFFLSYNFSNNFKLRIHKIKDDVVKIIDRNNYNSSVGARISFWIITYDILSENPIFGVGIGNQNNTKKRIIDNEYTTSMSTTRRLDHFHNSHLETLAQYGIVGYILFLSILVQILFLKIKDPVINSLKIILVVSFFYSGMALGVFYLSKSMSIFALILGIILAKYRIEYESNSTKLT